MDDETAQALKYLQQDNRDFTDKELRQQIRLLVDIILKMIDMHSKTLIVLEKLLEGAGAEALREIEKQLGIDPPKNFNN